jgi:hypothetical protein
VLDLTLTTLVLEAGQEHRDLPGLYAAAPKKAARLRAGDRLVLLLSQASASPAPNYAPLPPNLMQELLTRLAETYYTSTGSVTAGMKAMAERLNDFLINRNLRQSRQQTAQVVGLLNMAVVHGAYIYIAQSGPMHAYLINGSKVEHFTDAGGPARGLGLARLVNLRFFQAEVEPGVSLILSVDPPGAWKDSGLCAAATLDLAEMRTALIGDSLNLEGALVRFSPGKGEVRMVLPALKQPPPPVVEPAPATVPQGIYLSGKALAEPGSLTATAAVQTGRMESVQPMLRESPAPEAVEQEMDEPPEAVDEAPEISPLVETAAPPLDVPPWEESAVAPAWDGGAALPAEEMPAGEIQSAEPLPQQPMGGAERARANAAARAARQSTPAAAESAAPAVTAGQRSTDSRSIPRARETSAGAAAAARAANAVIGALRKAGAWFGGGINRLVARALPDQPTEGVHLSASTMLFIALAVPVLVVAVSATVYFQRGRGQMHAAAVHTAQQFADRAATQEDILLQREDWNQTVLWLERANKYGSSDEEVALRRQAQAGLDVLDGLTRLEFRPALTGTLGEGVQIKRMITVVNDVYLLDASQGRVLRIFRSGQGYEVDLGFVCTAGEYGGGTITIGPLVDITTLPSQNFVNAVVMGIDGQGNVLFCQPGQLPSAQTLLPPDMNWGTLARAVHLQGVLYVLDTKINQVYRYFFNEGNFVGKPGIYFDLQVPRLADVVDMAADQEYLYLLHADGSMTSCNSSGASTQCADPAPYGESREGRPSDPLKFDDAAFTLIQSTQPPDPALYVLDTLGPSIYSFSHRRLNLQRLYRPFTDSGYPPAGKTPQAFVITPNRRALLAVDNQLYMATMP